MARTERSATADPQLPVTESFARGLFALTAVKDEYEVARLHLLDEEQEAFARAFPGARPVYLLKPPLLARLGLRRKIKLVRTARPAFRLLRAGRHLRGTPFDLFGLVGRTPGRAELPGRLPGLGGGRPGPPHPRHRRRGRVRWSSWPTTSTGTPTCARRASPRSGPRRTGSSPR